MIDRKLLAKDIYEFLEKHGKRCADEPTEWSSPDACGMQAVAFLLETGLPPYHPWSSWGSGGYKPYTDDDAKELHDSLILRIEAVLAEDEKARALLNK